MSSILSKSTFLLLFTLSVSSFLSAQYQNFNKGKQSFEIGDFEKALQYFQMTLNAKDELKPRQYANVCYYRAKTYIQLLTKAARSGEEEQIKQYKDNFILAFQDLLEAKQQPFNDKKLEKNIATLSAELYLGLMDGGANFLRELYQRKGLSAKAKDELIDAAQRYFSASMSLAPEAYNACDFYGQVLMLKRDREGAMLHFRKAQELYQKNPPKTPDYQHFNSYANLAILLMQQRETDKALEVLNYAKNAVDSSWKKAQGDSLTYAQVDNDLQSLEMDIYLHSTKHRAEALVKFKAAVLENPDDAKLQLAFGNLLEAEGDMAAAINAYEQASKLDEKSFLAQYNFGVLLFKEAINLASRRKGTLTEEATTTITEQYNKALLPLQKAHALKPQDLKTLEALVLLSARLNMKEEYIQYKSLKRALK